MEFKLSFKMNNAAFEQSPEEEIKRILVDTWHRVVNGMVYGMIVDVNGNSVGEWEVTIESD